MGVIAAYVSWSDGKFFIYTLSEVGVSAMGDTVEKAKETFEALVSEYKEMCSESGADVPEELVGAYSIDYRMEASALLQELPISLRDLANASGLNQRQLSAYKNGTKVPREGTKVKILQGIKDIGETLSRVTLW